MGCGGSLWRNCTGRERRRQGGRRAARLVLWGGEARQAKPGRTAGDVMLDLAGGGRMVVCRADGFRLGRPAPVLAGEDRLEAGRTYLILPVDRLPAQGRNAVVTAASLAALSFDKSGGSPSLAGGARSPFEYVKDSDGRPVISVKQEFIVNAVTGRRRPPGGDQEAGDDGRWALCSTPELRKHYEQLVGAARGSPWSPRLETIRSGGLWTSSADSAPRGCWGASTHHKN